MKNYYKFKLNSDKILSQAINDCFYELYKRAQPSADFKQLVKKYEGTDTCFYTYYYLSQQELNYVVDKYVKAYNLESHFNDHIDLLIDCIKNGYSVDKYIEATKDSPGYRGYEKKPAFEKVIGLDNTKFFIDFLEERKNFYRFDHLLNTFKCTIYLGPSPTSNPKTVIEYWQKNGLDLTINPRNLTADDFWIEENE